MPTATSQNVPDLYLALREKGADKRAEALYQVYRSWLEHRRSQEPDWEENERFRDGDHWRFAFRGRLVDSKPQQSSVVRITLNHCRPIVHRIGAEHTKERPTFDVSGTTSETRDSAAARAGGMAVKWAWRELEMEQRLRDVAETCASTTTTLLHAYWDPTSGDEIEVTEDEIEEGVDESGPFERVAEKVVETRREGMPRVELVDWRRYCIAPWANLDEPGPALFIRDTVGLSDIVETYGQDVANKITPGLDDELEPADVPEPGRSDLSQRDQQVTIYICYTCRIDEEHPRGRKIVFTKETILEEEDNPAYPTLADTASSDPTWPFPAVRFHHYRVAGRWWQDGVIQDLRDLQLALNGLASKYLTMMKELAHPFMLMPTGYANPTGSNFLRVLNYNPRHGPAAIQYLQPPQLPQDIPAAMAFLIQQMNVISGFGQDAVGPEDSGRKVDLQQRKSETRQGSVKADHDRGISQVMTLVLKLLRDNWDHTRMIHVVGENNQTEAFALKASDLTGTMDVRIVNNTLSSDPTSRVLQLQQAVQTVQPLIAAGQTMLAQRVMALATGIEDFLQLSREMTHDRDKQEFENRLLYQGIPVEPDFGEDDEVHLAQLQTERDTQEWYFKYTVMPGDDKETAASKQEGRQLWDDHQLAHLEQRKAKSLGLGMTQFRQLQDQAENMGTTVDALLAQAAPTPPEQPPKQTATPPKFEPQPNPSVARPTPQ